jgi:hypothetical protein
VKWFVSSFKSKPIHYLARLSKTHVHNAHVYARFRKDAKAQVPSTPAASTALAEEDLQIYISTRGLALHGMPALPLITNVLDCLASF